MTWRFEGFDAEPVHEEVLVTFQTEDGGDGAVGIAGFGGGDRRSPLWLSGALEVRRSDRSLVLVAGTAQEADLVAGRADAAVPVVQRGPAGVAGPARGRGAGVRGGAGRRPRRRGRHLRRHRRGLRVGGRQPDPGRPGARLHQPERLRRPRPGRGPGRDEPRGHARGDRGAAVQRGAAVAARGVRRLRRPARRRPAALDHGRPDHRAGEPRRTAGPPARAGGVRRDRDPPRRGVRERLARLPGAGRRGWPGRPGPALRARSPAAGDLAGAAASPCSG